MNKEELTERIRYFQDVAARYGYCFVPASTVYLFFEEIARPDKLGLVTIRPGFYGRTINDEITHLIKLQALKGISYTIWWGVSLSFVPHEWNSKLRWHRTLKSARFDLFETPFDYFPLVATDWHEEEKYVVYGCHGELYLKGELEEMWRQVEQDVLAWFLSTETLEGILKRAREQTERKWVGPRHHPEPLMVYAFTLARLGQIKEARTILDQYFGFKLEPVEAQANLNRALEKASAG